MRREEVGTLKTGEIPEALMDEVKENLKRVEEATGWGVARGSEVTIEK